MKTATMKTTSMRTTTTMKSPARVAGFTAEGVFVKLSVPEGMDAALQGLTREVLRHQPGDIYSFAAQYFESLVRARGRARGRTGGGHAEEFTTVTHIEETTASTRSLGSSVASLAATTGTVAVLATASASQPSAPPWGGGSQVHVVKGKVTELAGENSSSGSEKASKKRRPKKDKHADREADKEGGAKLQGRAAKYSELTHQVDAIAHGLAHDTVVTTEEISKQLDDKSRATAEGSTTKQRTRRLKRQTKSVDSSSLSDRSDNGSKKQVAGVQNLHAAAVETSSEEAKQEKTHESHVAVEKAHEADELEQLHSWANGAAGADKATDASGQQGAQHEGGAHGEPETSFSHYESSFVATETAGENAADFKAEELRVLAEGSVRKSSVHDVLQETTADGSHKTTEEKAEETMEQKLQASEKTTLERKSNVQVGENGDVVEEEITITRTEHSTTQETTVSKSWTMETTIETLADGETRVVERMILHSPPLEAAAAAADDTHLDSSTSVTTGLHTAVHDGEEVSVTASEARREFGLVEGEDAQVSLQHIGAALEAGERALGEVPHAAGVAEDAVVTAAVVEHGQVVGGEGARKEFGLIDPEEAMKSMEQISAALSQAEESLSLVGGEVESHVAAAAVVDGEAVAKREFALIEPEEAKKSLEQISAALVLAEDSLDKLHQENASASEQVEIVSKEEHASENQHVEVDENAEVKSHATDEVQHAEVDEDGKVHSHETEAKRTQDEAGKVHHHDEVDENAEVQSHKSTEAQHAEVDEDGKEHSHENEATLVQDEQSKVHHHENDEVRHVEVDENAEVLSHETEKAHRDEASVHSHAETKDASRVLEMESHVTEERSAHDVTIVDHATVVTTTSIVETLDAKPEEAVVDEDKDKREKPSSPTGDTDDDQATPREDSEARSEDTPGHSSKCSSAGSEENGGLMNPLTVVISRTADVVELKDGEVNIVTQMEKEGLVEGVGEGAAGPEGPESLEKIITKGALQTLSGEVTPQRVSPKVAGITVMAASVVGLLAAERGDDAVGHEADLEGGGVEALAEIDGDTVEVIAGGFDSSQFIHEEAKHSAWLLQEPSFEDDVVRTAASAKDAHVHGDAGHGSEHVVEKTEAHSSVESSADTSHAHHAQSGETAVEQQHAALQQATRDAAGNSTDPELDEHGKPIPVDENGKPMYPARKKRSLEEPRAVSLANDIIPDSSKVKLSRTGSLASAEQEHWYASNMGAAGSALIKPALAMSRDPSLASLQPCDEPECVAVDVRDAKNAAGIATPVGSIKEGFDVMHEMSLVTSRVGQSILTLGTEAKKDDADQADAETRGPARSDSQESFIISEDAVYIPLNPAGAKQPSLERIDSVPSLAESARNDADSAAAATAAAIVATTTVAMVEHTADPGSPRTYTVTEPKSAEDRVSENNQDDDVLIVEYPTDPHEKVTKWDNVVVTSPADLKVGEVVEARHHELMEPQSHLSMDDSLQEVPSLQDEAVLQEESESELPDSMPEEDGDRRWTDDVAKAASKAASMVKGIFSRGNSLLHSDSGEVPAADNLANAATEIETKVHSAAVGVKQAVYEGGEAAAHSISALGEDAVSAAKDASEAAVSESAHAVSAATGAVVETAEKAAETLASVKDSVKSEAAAVADSVKDAVDHAKIAAEAAKDAAAEAASSVVADVKDASRKAGEHVEEAVGAVKHTAHELGDEVSTVVSEAKQGVEGLAEDVEKAVGAVEHKAHELGNEVVSEAKQGAEGLAEDVKGGVKAVHAEVTRGAHHAVEAAGDAAAELKHGAASVAEAVSSQVAEGASAASSAIADAVDSAEAGVKSLADNAAETASNAKDALKSAAESAEAEAKSLVDGAAETASDAKQALKLAAEIAEAQAKSLADSAAETVSEAKEALKSAAESAEAGAKSLVVETASEAKEALKSAAESAEAGAKSLVDGVAETASEAKEALKSAAESAEAEAKSLVDGVAETASEAKEALKSAAESAEAGAKNLVDGVAETASEAKEALKSAAESAEAEAKSLVDGAARTAADAKDAIKSAADSLVDSAAETASDAKEALKSAADNAKAGAQSIVDSVDETVSDAKEALKSAVDSAEAGAKSAVESAAETASNAKEALKSAADSAEAGARSLVDSAAETASDAKETLKSAADSAKAGAKNLVDSAAETASDAKEALKSAAGSVAETIETSVVSVKEGVAAAARTVSHEVAGGVAAAGARVDEAAENLARSVAESKDSAKTVFDEGVAHIVSEVTAAEEAAADSVKSTAEGVKSIESSVVKEASDVLDSVNEAATEAVSRTKRAAEDLQESALAEASSAEDTVVSSASSALHGAELLSRRVEEEAEHAVRSAVESAHRQEEELRQSLTSAQQDTAEATRSLALAAEDEAVTALAEASVLKELAEKTVTSEAATAEQQVQHHADDTLAALEHTDESVKSALKHAEETISAEARKAHSDVAAKEGETAEGMLQAGQTETVAALELADESVRNALRHAEETITAESLKTNFPFGGNEGRTTTKEEHVSETVAALERADESVRSALKHAEDTITAKTHEAHAKERESAGSEAVATLERVDESVRNALTHAEETISAEARRTQSFVSERSETHAVTSQQAETSQVSTTTESTIKDETVATLEQAELSVKQALSHAEDTITSEASTRRVVSSNAESTVNTTTTVVEESSTVESHSETSESMERVVSTATATASAAHKMSEGIHERVRKQVSVLRDDAPQSSPRDRSQEGTSRRGRAVSDITSRKAPSKSDSWESNLRKSTVASTGKVTRTATVSGSEAAAKKGLHTPRNAKKAATQPGEAKTSTAAADAKRRPPLRKAKSLAEDSSEDNKTRVKKMPSQGSTKRTAISVESVVEAAGESVVQRALEKARTSQESADEGSSETSTTVSTTTTSTSTSSRQRRHSSEEVRSVASTELVHAAATIQEAFRGMSENKVPVDENAVPTTLRGGLQIEPVLEEIAEEVGLERQGSSRRGSRQDSQNADNEDTSTSESSLSSAATRIQAGFRGHLARRHRLAGRHGTAGTTSTMSMSMSRDSEAGVVRAMSLLEDSEVQRHQLDTLDLLPEADEYGPAKYVAEVYRAQAARGDMDPGKKGLEWARSLDSGLSSGPERHTPVRTAMSVQQRARLRDADLDEHVWRTLEQEMLAAGHATDDSEGHGDAGGSRRLSTRRGLHRGNAMQMPTTSSSTPGSLEEAASTRHTGEFHDMLVLPLPPSPGKAPARLRWADVAARLVRRHAQRPASPSSRRTLQLDALPWPCLPRGSPTTPPPSIPGGRYFCIFSPLSCAPRHGPAPPWALGWGTRHPMTHAPPARPAVLPGLPTRAAGPALASPAWLRCSVGLVPGGLLESSVEPAAALHPRSVRALPSYPRPRAAESREDKGNHAGFPTATSPSRPVAQSRGPPSQVELRPASGANRAGFSLNGSTATSLDAVPRAAPQQEAQPRAPSAASAATTPGPPPTLPTDPPSDTSMKTAEVAATKIQAGFRGYKVRRQLREQSLDQSKEGGSEQSAQSAAAGEAAPGQQALGLLGLLGGPRGAGVLADVSPAESQCRGSQHHPMAALEGELEAALDEDLLQRSAARIQASVRGFLVRRRQHNAAVAAAKIQAGFRGYRTRRELKQRNGLRSANKNAFKANMMASRQAAQ